MNSKKRNNQELHNKLITSIGFGFPESEQQLSYFNITHKDYTFESRPDKIDPQKIWDRLAQKNESKASKTDYHKRTVLSAEIVYRLRGDRHLGHVKLEKLVYLCQNMANISVHAQFTKHPMGPYDPKLIRSLDTQFLTRKWFSYSRDTTPKYKALEKVGEHKKWFEIYYGAKKKEFDFVINTFGKFNMEQIELVATIFDCWKTILENRETLSNDLIIKRVYGWSEGKAKFTKTRITSAINWMKEKGIYPELISD